MFISKTISNVQPTVCLSMIIYVAKMFPEDVIPIYLVHITRNMLACNALSETYPHVTSTSTSRCIPTVTSCLDEMWDIRHEGHQA